MLSLYLTHSYVSWRSTSSARAAATILASGTVVVFFLTSWFDWLIDKKLHLRDCAGKFTLQKRPSQNHFFLGVRSFGFSEIQLGYDKFDTPSFRVTYHILSLLDHFRQKSLSLFWLPLVCHTWMCYELVILLNRLECREQEPIISRFVFRVSWTWEFTSPLGLFVHVSPFPAKHFLRQRRVAPLRAICGRGTATYVSGYLNRTLLKHFAPCLKSPWKWS